MFTDSAVSSNERMLNRVIHTSGVAMFVMVARPGGRCYAKCKVDRCFAVAALSS